MSVSVSVCMGVYLDILATSFWYLSSTGRNLSLCPFPSLPLSPPHLICSERAELRSNLWVTLKLINVLPVTCVEAECSFTFPSPNLRTSEGGYVPKPVGRSEVVPCRLHSGKADTQ